MEQDLLIVVHYVLNLQRLVQVLHQPLRQYQRLLQVLRLMQHRLLLQVLLLMQHLLLLQALQQIYMYITMRTYLTARLVDLT